MKNNFITDLKQYFVSTPREKVLLDWEKTEEFDQVGPTMDQFLAANNRKNWFEKLPRHWQLLFYWLTGILTGIGIMAAIN